jgi:sugar lactone lactonase YvrE
LSGLSPNGILFSADSRRLFVANTYQDSIIVFDVDANGRISSDGRLFARFPNNDLEVYPSGFDGLVAGHPHWLQREYAGQRP